MIYFFIFLSLFCTANTMHSMNDFAAFAKKQYIATYNNTKDKYTENFFTFSDQLKKCKEKDTAQEINKCNNNVASEIKKSIKDDFQALTTIAATEAAVILAQGVFRQVGCNELSDATGRASQKILCTCGFFTSIDLAAKNYLLATLRHK